MSTDSPDRDPRRHREVPVVDALRESEARFRALAEHARDVILEITPEAHFVYVSPSARDSFGYEPAELVGRNALELVHPDDLANVDAIRVSVFENRTSAILVFRFRRGDGTWAWVELTGRPYVRPDGALRGVLIARDISGRMDAERNLREQVEQERRAADLARQFITLSVDNYESTLVAGLESIGRSAGAGRVQLYLLDHGGVEAAFDWTASEVADRVTIPAVGDVMRFQYAARQLVAGNAWHVPSVRALPADAAAEREALSAVDAQSYLAIPLGEEGALVGFVDFARFGAERPWDDAEIGRIQLIAQVLTGALRRVRAERERREAEERLRTLTSYAQDTLCEIALDGRITYLSENFTKQLGHTVDSLGGAGAWKLVHPDDLAAVRSQMLGAVQDDEGRDVTFRVRHRDGSWRWLEAVVNPFDKSPGERRLVVVLRDVTDRHVQRLELERELALEKQVADFSRDLLEISADGIDAGIQHGLGVAAQLAGADRAFLMSWFDGDTAAPETHHWQAMGSESLSYEWNEQRRTHRWVRDRLLSGEVVRVPDADSIPDPEVRREFEESQFKSFLCIPIFAGLRLMGVLGFHCMSRTRDWSDREIALLRLLADLFTSALRRKEAEDGLAESQHNLLQAQKMEAVGTLAGGIAHDFNNQLTVMLSNARYALRESEPGSEVHHALDDLRRAAEHCAQLTRSLLAFSRRTPVATTSLAIGNVIGETEELLRPLIPSSIRLSVTVDDPDACIAADRTQLQQVLVNLVVNARDAIAHDGGRLSVAASQRDLTGAEAMQLGVLGPGRFAEFSVRDNGPGMDEQVRARVFEPFFTTKPLGEGTGLGLATAYGIVEQLGGAISVDSAPGEGSTFRVFLPSAEGSDADDEVSETDTPSSGVGTVLLAEDEGGVRRLLARTLRDAGYRVIEAPDGAEALRLGRQQMTALDAIVTDVDMPRLSGVELARRLARHRPDLPVLFISGSSPEELGIRDLDAAAGRLFFLAKPFSEQRLLERVLEVLEG